MSFRKRTSLALTLLCLALLGLASFLVQWGYRRSMLENLDQALLAISRTEAASALDGGQVHLHEGPFANAGYQRFAQISRPGGPVMARSTNLKGTLPRSQLEWTQVPLLTEMTWEEQRYRVVYFPCQPGLVALVATPLAPLQQAIKSLSDWLLLVLAGGGVLACLGSYLLASSLTRPLERVAREAGRLGPDDLAGRISGPVPVREVEQLRTAINGLMGELQTAFEAQQEFLSDSSHELRTPLTNLIGQLEVALRRERSEQEYVRVLQVALAEGRRLARLVEDLTLLTHLDLTLGPVDLNAVVGASLEGFRQRAQLANVELVLVSEKAITLHSDPDRLRQVLDNLLDNALRYAPAGSLVEVRLREAGSQTLLQVSDQGPGLEEADCYRIFERFYRPDPARHRATGGSGLGLAIVRAIVVALGGTVWVKSQPGHGASFSVSLPK